MNNEELPTKSLDGNIYTSQSETEKHDKLLYQNIKPELGTSKSNHQQNNNNFKSQETTAMYNKLLFEDKIHNNQFKK